MKAGLARHDLVRVAPERWSTVAATRQASPALPDSGWSLVEDWGREGQPVIVRRMMPGDPADALPVGLPLPPSLGKARVALAIPRGVEARHVGAVTLDAVRAVAPTAWFATIDAAVALGGRLGVVANVFGALLWQSLTGLPYLHADSDLDLLWPVADPANLCALLDGLEHLQAAAPMRIDGEVRTRLGDVNWRELASARSGTVDVVLAKTLRRAAFVPASDILPGEIAACP